MRWTSVILILSVGYALSHDAMYHEGGGKASVKYLPHHEHEHSHSAHFRTDHCEHSRQNAHDSDHYDDMHDHQLKPLPAKKDVSAQQRVECIQIALAGFSMSAAVGPTNTGPVIYDTELSLPGYVRAQILLL